MANFYNVATLEQLEGQLKLLIEEGQTLLDGNPHFVI